MHWINDLPGHLIQIRKLLKKDGFFTANLIGGNSLVELRNALAEAESEISSSISPRISPMIDLRDGAALIQRTGFREPVSTSEEITVKYSSFYDLLRDIKFSGEGSSLIKQNKNIPPRELFKKAENIYKQKFSDEEGNLNATIEVITISGWKI